MSSQRKLAAIMFTDMVGYTRLMQKDEHHATSLRDRHRAVLEKEIYDHEGEILQYYGDGTLCIFPSSISAVKCALRIQDQLLQEPPVPLRIGLHSGDIVHDEEGIYGDGVNIASRIESLSIAGSVLFSGKIMDDIKNQKDLEVESLGRFSLKNVEAPIEIFALTNSPLNIPDAENMVGKGEKIKKSLAVLPFVNMSTDPENEYFSDGITEEILNALTRVNEIRVTARTSSFAFKNKNLDIREVAHQLNVDHILEGSVRKSGKRVRIGAQLISAKDGFHIWSENFDRELEDIFAVQDEIAQNITAKLSERLVEKSLVRSTTQNLEAYNLYLKGSFHWKKWSPEGVRKSIAFFEKAIALEPDFSLPHSGLASAYILMGTTGNMGGDAFEKATAAAEKALALDDQHDGANLAMGMIKFLYDKDQKAAKKYLTKALSINPGSAEGHHYYAMYHCNGRDFEKALVEIEKAHHLDPLSLIILGSFAQISFFAGYNEKAVERYHQALELDPNFRSAWEGMGWIYALEEKYEKALDAFTRYQSMTGSRLKGITGLGYTLARSGRRGEAHECLKLLEERKQLDKDTILDLDFAMIYAGLKDWDKVYHHLKAAVEVKMGGLFLNIHPMWEEVRQKQRFRDLLSKHGLLTA
ncbi:MAG: adenylate/guanylate cyclase domain-containing protein [Cyclobacteriaceae bacterium]